MRQANIKYLIFEKKASDLETLLMQINAQLNYVAYDDEQSLANILSKFEFILRAALNLNVEISRQLAISTKQPNANSSLINSLHSLLARMVLVQVQSYAALQKTKEKLEDAKQQIILQDSFQEAQEREHEAYLIQVRIAAKDATAQLEEKVLPGILLTLATILSYEEEETITEDMFIENAQIKLAEHLNHSLEFAHDQSIDLAHHLKEFSTRVERCLLEFYRNEDRYHNSQIATVLLFEKVSEISRDTLNKIIFAMMLQSGIDEVIEDLPQSFNNPVSELCATR